MPARWLVSLLALTGCVTQSAYDKLQADCEESQAQLEARNQSVRSSERASEAAQAGEAETKAELDRRRDDVRELEQRITRLSAQLAAIVKDKSTLEASVTEMTAALVDLDKRRAEADARLREFRELLDKFRSLIHAGKLRVKIVDGKMVVVMQSDVLFGSGSASLSKDGRAELAEVARLLASIPKRKFQIEGHTDNVPIGTAQYPSNWELSSARAVSVLKTMVDAGLPAPRISAAAFGDTAPASPNDTPEGRSANRRIEITVVPDLSLLPGAEELNRAEQNP